MLVKPALCMTYTKGGQLKVINMNLQRFNLDYWKKPLAVAADKGIYSRSVLTDSGTCFLGFFLFVERIFSEGIFRVPNSGKPSAMHQSEADCQLVLLVLLADFCVAQIQIHIRVGSGVPKVEQSEKPERLHVSVTVTVSGSRLERLNFSTCCTFAVALHSQLLNWSDLQSIIAKEKFLKSHKTFERESGATHSTPPRSQYARVDSTDDISLICALIHHPLPSNGNGLSSYVHFHCYLANWLSGQFQTPTATATAYLLIAI